MRMYDPQHYRVRVQTVCEVGGLISRLTCKQDQWHVHNNDKQWMTGVAAVWHIYIWRVSSYNVNPSKTGVTASNYINTQCQAHGQSSASGQYQTAVPVPCPQPIHTCQPGRTPMVDAFLIWMHDCTHPMGSSKIKNTKVTISFKYINRHHGFMLT